MAKVRLARSSERPVMHESGQPIDYSDLDERFTPYYILQERVEVTWKEGYEDYTGYGARTDGRKARFYVGRSSGWKPIYIQLDNNRSVGGQAILSDAVESIRPLGIYHWTRIS